MQVMRPTLLCCQIALIGNKFLVIMQHLALTLDYLVLRTYYDGLINPPGTMYKYIVMYNESAWV